jgi:hypothetical protein
VSAPTPSVTQLINFRDVVCQRCENRGEECEWLSTGKGQSCKACARTKHKCSVREEDSDASPTKKCKNTTPPPPPSPSPLPPSPPPPSITERVLRKLLREMREFQQEVDEANAAAADMREDLVRILTPQYQEFKQKRQRRAAARARRTNQAAGRGEVTEVVQVRGDVENAPEDGNDEAQPEMSGQGGGSGGEVKEGEVTKELEVAAQE